MEKKVLAAGGGWLSRGSGSSFRTNIRLRSGLSGLLALQAVFLVSTAAASQIANRVLTPAQGTTAQNVTVTVTDTTPEGGANGALNRGVGQFQSIGQMSGPITSRVTNYEAA